MSADLSTYSYTGRIVMIRSLGLRGWITAWREWGGYVWATVETEDGERWTNVPITGEPEAEVVLVDADAPPAAPAPGPRVPDLSAGDLADLTAPDLARATLVALERGARVRPEAVRALAHAVLRQGGA